MAIANFACPRRAGARIKRARTVRPLIIAAAAMLLSGAAHAASACIQNADGTYDTLLLGQQELVYPSNGSNVATLLGTDPSGYYPAGGGYGGNVNAVGPAGYTTINPGGLYGTLGSHASYPAGSTVVSLAQSVSGPGATNTCVNGGANASNTLATQAYVQTAVAAATKGRAAREKLDSGSDGTPTPMVAVWKPVQGTAEPAPVVLPLALQRAPVDLIERELATRKMTIEADLAKRRQEVADLNAESKRLAAELEAKAAQIEELTSERDALANRTHRNTCKLRRPVVSAGSF